MDIIWAHPVVNILFIAGFIINSILFLLQAYRIYQTKDAEDVSLITFVGLTITQIAAIWYGYINRDVLLMWGFIIAAISCGLVTLQVVYYRLKDSMPAPR
ncbi:MAG: hypothetical protein K0R12_986 [Gammaproteobacteria bacterium]|jgi:MtN3 and saliva related transmembrane protein|nr:hypothetical protein [Gammaproteobacteria bacterium]